MHANESATMSNNGKNNLPESYRRAVSSKTGATLMALGALLANLQPADEDVNERASKTLIKIGRKLTTGKAR